MPAYVYADIEVTDLTAYEEYRNKVPAIIASYGGRYLVRGGKVEVLEGDVVPKRQIILEFPDMAQLHAFYNSSEYQPLKALRQRCGSGSILAISGI